MRENYDLVQKGIGILHPILANYIGMRMVSEYGDDYWWPEVLYTLRDPIELPKKGDYGTLVDSLDFANCIRLIQHKWPDVFSKKLSMNCKTWATELMGVRNDTAHIGNTDFTQAYAERALDTMALLCERIDPESTEEIRALYRKLRYGSEAGSTAAVPQQPAESEVKQGQVGAVVEGGKLPSWRDVMVPHPDVAEGRYATAEFAADLWQVANGDGTVEYRDPVEFFARTYVTDGMAGLLLQFLERISGKGGEPVIQLKTAFGGGKTHSMLALYHIAHGRMKLDSVPSLKPVMERAGLSDFPHANVAVLVGTALNAAERREYENLPGYSVSTLWGEMAYQLVTSAGKPELYGKYISEADKKGVAPGSENLKNLFNECGPCLILMDELVAYAKNIYGVDGLPSGSFDNFITFIQQITEAARASENSIVVASIPESAIEIGGDAGQKALEAIEHTFGRMESIWKPVAADEGFEVVRRRLFLNCKDEKARDAVCSAFSQMYLNNAADFPPECKEVAYRDRLISCYPIHPEVFDRLYEDWSTLEKFQRTRSVLRLMAKVIHELWMARDGSAMIMPGSFNLDMPHVRDELTRYLPNNWNSIIDHEVDGKNSIPYQKDMENSRYGQVLACRRVARTVMLGSSPSTTALRDQGIRGLETSRIVLGTAQPGESIPNFKDALNTLRGSLSYLYNNQSGTRFWYDTKPTLRKTAEDRASQVSEADVDVEIEKRLKKSRRENPFAGVHAAPASSNDVPDEMAVRLVILRPNDIYKAKTPDNSPAMKTVQNILNTRGSSPRIYRNMLVFAAPDETKMFDLKKKVKSYLAWNSILSDKEDLNLDGQQVRDAEHALKTSNEEVDSGLNAAYCRLLIPYIDIDANGVMKDTKWTVQDLGGGQDSIVTKAAKSVIQSEQVIAKWAPLTLQIELDNYLWKDSDNIQVKKLWEYLCTYCYLPRLSNYGVLEDAIREGSAKEDFFGIAAGHDGNKYIDLKLGESVLTIHNSDLLVKPSVAKAQIQKENPPVDIDNGGDNEGGGGSEQVDPPVLPKPPVQDHLSHHFHMSANVDPLRANKSVSDYVNEIISHLTGLEGAKVELTLEVDVTAPNGIPTDIVRIVRENCNSLKVKYNQFDD